MSRPVKFPELTGLRPETHAFYTQRALEGIHPTEDALQVIRNEEARHGEGERRTAASHKRKPSPKVVRKEPKPVYAWTEREPLRPMRITREDALARKAW